MRAMVGVGRGVILALPMLVAVAAAALAPTDGSAWTSPSGRIAVLAGTGGTVSTLECYKLPSPWRAHPWWGASKNDPFSPCNTSPPPPTGIHGGSWYGRTDIQTFGTTPAVYAQLDYLPDSASGVAGGEIYATSDLTGCASYAAGTAGYNGIKVKVDIVFRNRFGTQLNGLSVLYEHVAAGPYVWPSAHSYKWNNPTAYQRLWSVEDFRLNDSINGGMPLGNVAQVVPPYDYSCSTGNHLHQASAAGVYNYARFIGEGINARVSDIEFVSLANITGDAPTDR